VYYFVCVVSPLVDNVLCCGNGLCSKMVYLSLVRYTVVEIVGLCSKMVDLNSVRYCVVEIVRLCSKMVDPSFVRRCLVEAGSDCFKMAVCIYLDALKWHR